MRKAISFLRNGFFYCYERPTFADMIHKNSSATLLFKRLGLVLLGYSICRLLFFIFNSHYFLALSFKEIFYSFFIGLRYDITAIVITNTPIILLHLLPEKIFNRTFVQSTTKFIFFLINAFMFLLNAIDFGLFRFTAKRATSDVFKILSYGNDFKNTAPQMILDFWYVLLILLLLWWSIFKYYPRSQSSIHQVYKKDYNFKFTKTVTLLSIIGLYFIGFRGGIQFKPLSIISASKYGSGIMAPLILNTPFTFVKTFGKSELQPIRYMTDEEAQQTITFIHSPSKKDFRKLNVVVIILESFGKEYSGFLNNAKGYTPFLDSLMKKSFYCTNAFANGKRSIEGIPAITAGIPALSNEPLITSSYGVNQMTSMANVLSEQGYSTFFFHGGTNGTMGFDNFAKAIGYQHYFGRNEYNNDQDFDGTWGIYDEPFLKRVSDELSKSISPFFATVFTLSSHHPYSIPSKYNSVFEAGTLPIHKSIQYADYSLRTFFESASKQKWFNSTLFVITADHTALSEKQFYMTRQGIYSIPLLFYSPGDSLSGIENKTCQQIDILPSVLGYLNYNKPFFAFGRNIFDLTSSGFAISFLNDSYQWIEGNHTFISDATNRGEYFQFSEASPQTLETKSDSSVIHKKLNSFIQQYNSALINNKMKVH